jgi:hypothetical protein
MTEMLWPPLAEDHKEAECPQSIRPAIACGLTRPPLVKRPAWQTKILGRTPNFSICFRLYG